MLKNKMFAVIAVATLVAVPYSQFPKSLCEGFLPENDLQISVDSKSNKGITEAEFNEVLDKIETIYTPIISDKGGSLKVKRLWDNNTVNASAQQWGSTWIINMYGGLARHEAITQDGFALVACHEIGHHVGGAPKIGSRWASNEGQSDYFAGLKCLRLVFADKSASGFSRPAAMADPFVKQKCGEKYSGKKERALCERIANAGMSVSSLFKIGRGEDRTPRFNEPDQKEVEQTDDRHPGTQCRLDTYFSGGLCPKAVSDDVDRFDPSKGTCTRQEGYTWAARPKCWYLPPAGASELEIVRQAIDQGPVTSAPKAFQKEGSAFASLRQLAGSSR
jgi:hypothetical protein